MAYYVRKCPCVLEMPAKVCRDKMTRCLKFVLKYFSKKREASQLNKCGRILIMVEAHDGSIVSHSTILLLCILETSHWNEGRDGEEGGGCQENCERFPRISLKECSYPTSLRTSSGEPTQVNSPIVCRLMYVHMCIFPQGKNFHSFQERLRGVVTPPPHPKRLRTRYLKDENPVWSQRFLPFTSNWSLPTAPQAGCGCVALTRIRPTTTTQIPFLHL